MKKIVVLAVVLATQGCAGFVPYVQQHAAGLAATATVAGVVASTTSAITNTITLGEKVIGDDDKK